MTTPDSAIRPTRDWTPTVAWIWLLTGGLLLAGGLMCLWIDLSLPPDLVPLPPDAPPALVALEPILALARYLAGAGAVQVALGVAELVGGAGLRRRHAWARLVLVWLTWGTLAFGLALTWLSGPWLVTVVAHLSNVLALPGSPPSARSIEVTNFVTGVVGLSPLIWVGWRLHDPALRQELRRD